MSSHVWLKVITSGSFAGEGSQLVALAILFLVSICLTGLTYEDQIDCQNMRSFSLFALKVRWAR